MSCKEAHGFNVGAMLNAIKHFFHYRWDEIATP
jgi:hypothetical protein